MQQQLAVTLCNRKFYRILSSITLKPGCRYSYQDLHAWNAIALYNVDQYWIRLQPSANWFYSIRRIGRQRPGYSDLMGTNVSYDY
jgi:hypothetical protein